MARDNAQENPDNYLRLANYFTSSLAGALQMVGIGLEIPLHHYSVFRLGN
jgi:hypothetical protein